MIEKKLICFRSYNTFLDKVVDPNTPTVTNSNPGLCQYGELYGWSIVYILDTKQLWTHGTLFDCDSAAILDVIEANEAATDERFDSINERMNKIPLENRTETAFTWTPNVFHVWGEVSSLTLTFPTSLDNSIYNEFMMEFSTGNTIPTIAFPSSITWQTAPSLHSNKKYHVSVVNNLGLIVEF